MLSSFPAGYLLAWLCKDELLTGRKYFFALSITSLISIIVIGLINIENKAKFSIILVLLYIIIVSMISYWKSYDLKFLGRYVKGNA